MANQTSEVRSGNSTSNASVPPVDMKLEVIVIPVSDVDRAKKFYTQLGWRLDADYASDAGDFRVVQFTPPGSGCSVIFGKNVTQAAPGTAQGLYLIVPEIEAARADLVSRGIDVTGVFHDAAGVYTGADEAYIFGRVRVAGRDPEHRSYRSFASFHDPDGNGWLLQELKTRLPGRGLSLDVPSMAELLRETEEHHGQYEPTAPKHHWSDWYAAYLIARINGKTAGDAAQEAGHHMEQTRAAA